MNKLTGQRAALDFGNGANHHCFTIATALVLLNWSRTSWQAREMRVQLTALRLREETSVSDAKDIRLQLERATGTAAALSGLSAPELESLEAAASRSLSRIREQLEEVRRRSNEALTRHQRKQLGTI